MKLCRSFACRFLVGVALLSATLRPGATQQPGKLTYTTFLEHARALVPPATRAEILAVLGAPLTETDASLGYSLLDLPGFPGLPGPVGTQIFPAASISLNHGRMSGPIQWSWFDTTGPAPRP